MHACVHANVYTCAFMFFVCVSVYMQMCTHVYHGFLYVYKYTYMYACMQMCTHIYGGSRLMLKNILGHFSTLLIEARFLSQIQSLDS